VRFPLDTQVIVNLRSLDGSEMTEIGIIAKVRDHVYTVHLCCLESIDWDVREDEVERAVFSFAGPVAVTP